MPGLHLSDGETVERLKAALWYSIGQTIDALSLEQDVNATPQFIGALTELVWTQLENATLDLEAFARHGGRKIIGTQDVMLLVRRNEALATLLGTQ